MGQAAIGRTIDDITPTIISMSAGRISDPCNRRGAKLLGRLIAAAVAGASIGLRADTYTLVNTSGTASSPAEFSDLNNWTVGGQPAAVLPGAGDTITWEGGDWIYPYIALDGDYTVGSLTKSFRRPHWVKSANAAQDVVTLTFVTQLGAGAYQNYYVHQGVKMVIAGGATLYGATSDATASEATAQDGGEIDVLGDVRSRHIKWNVKNGGVLYFAPTLYKQSTDTSSINDQFSIDGSDSSIEFPNGLTITGGNASWDNRFNHNNGTVSFGGPFVSNSPWIYTWKAGTIAATADVSFGDTVSFVIPDSKSVTADVSLGATLAIPASASIGSGVTLTKTGSGDICFDGATLPAIVAVAAGGLVVHIGDTSYDLSPVSFSAGSKIKIAATGVTLSAFDASIANATFSVADGFIPASGAAVLTCSDATVLAQAQAGLNASLAGTGMRVEISSGTLVAESHYTFNSSTVTDMNDTAGWANGIAAPAGQPAMIAGSGTVAVMDDNVPEYSAISVEDGATLTIAATRNIPAVALVAGTALNVAATDGSVVLEDQSHSGYVMDTDTLVGAMSPSRSLSEITNIVGIRGGGWFGERDTSYTYVNAKLLDDGARLHVQFIYNDSDWTKCAIVDFTKDGQGNIYARGVGAGYVSPTNEAVDFDEIEYTAATYGTSNTSGAYGVKNLTFKAPVAHGGPSTVTAVGDFRTAGYGLVTVGVAADCVLDLSCVGVTTAATLVKTGDGAIVFGDELPTALNVTEGVLALQPYVEYDLSDVTLEGGVDIKVAVDGTLKDGVAFVQPNGKTIFMSSGVYVGVGTWATVANWVNSEIPDGSAAVHVHGAGTVLTIDDASVTMPASISVEAGATLRVLADVTLPPLSIDSTSKVVFGDNETQPKVAAVLDASLTTIADATVTPVALPIMEIATNATLSVASGMKFKNVDFRLYGTVTKDGTSASSPKFGYAEVGETAYIAFTSDGGVFDFHSNQNKSNGSVSFVCPVAGGTVIPVGTVVLRKSSRPVNGWTDFGNWEFGCDNPTTVPFDVLVDGTAIDVAAEFYASGAAHLSLVNSACIRRNASCLGHGFNMMIQNAATISVDNDCYVTFTTGDGSFAIDSQSAVDAVTVRNGGDYTVTYNSSGSKLGTFVSDGGVVGVDQLRSPSGSSTPRAPRSDLLRGFGSVRLDGDLAIVSRNSGAGTVNWDRHVTMANVPFTGTGDVTITNGVPAYPFTVTMVSGANTATGSIKVAKAEDDAETALYFADGANWAGTVVAGNVALTNLTDGTAASVSFGELDLAADFQIRVWDDAGTMTYDTLDVGRYVNNGGRLVPTMMTDGVDFVDRSIIEVGKIAKGATLPTVGSGWVAKTVAIDGDDDNEKLVLQLGAGIQVILR